MAFPHPFSRLHSEFRAMRRNLPIEVSNIALNEFKGNFRRSGFRSATGVTAWEKRKKDKDPGRGLLMKSGRLRRSLRIAPDALHARVVTNVPYAQIHNEGGTITANVSVKSHKRKGKPVMSHSRKMNTTIPARPFMNSTAPLLKDIEKHIDDKLTKIWNRA